MGFPRGSVCSAAQTGKPDITERRSGVGRSLRRPRSLARSLRSLCGRAARTGGGGGGGGGAAGACLCSVRRGRSGLGPEAPRQSRAGTAFAWKQGAPCRVHTPERKLRMKLLWQAKMSSIQDWGEEVEEGAVYHVTLKRVQIQQAANKGARWLGVSKAGETVNFGLAVSVFCEYHYLAEAGFPSPPFPPIISFNLKKGNYSDQVFAVAVLVCFPKYLPRFVNNSEPLGNILRYLANRVGMEWQNVAQNYRTRK
uniref:Uncharacterized protein n=1 Tax=Sus scrofa TaxID=9823 RepID=A0A8D0YNQ5_PIG